MGGLSRRVALAAVTLLGMTALVILLTILLLGPPLRDLAAIASFLLISGGVTVLLGLAVPRMPSPPWLGSLRSKLVLVSVLTAILALVNVGFTAVLMFLSGHDLALLAGLLGFSVGMAIFVAFALSEPTTRSIRDLMQGARNMSAGRLDAQVPVDTNDEVGELALAFNTMSDRLRSSFGRERELEQARRELISAVSHDLRTPLASIRVMLESINDGVVADPDTVGRYIRTSLTEVENLGQLVNDLFELSQIDAGVLELHMEAASLQDLISDTLESMSAQAAVHNLSLKGSLDGEITPVVMDTRTGAASALQPGAELHPPHAARRDYPDTGQGRGGGGAGGGGRYGRGHSGGGPAPAVRVVLQGRPVTIERVRGRGPGAEHSQGHSGGARGSHMGGERVGGGRYLQLHVAQGPGRERGRRVGVAQESLAAPTSACNSCSWNWAS